MAVRPDSFEFSGIDMLTTYGIRCISSDVLQPKPRVRKVSVPGRDGTHDFGARNYDERQLRLSCDSMAALTRHQIRELSYLLARKGRIVLWDEPDKYYLGRLYDDAQLKYIGLIGHEFTLTFTCDPFAYGATVDRAMPEKFVGVDQYQGTASTSTRIALTNTGTAVIQGLHIVVREERVE